MTVAALGMWVCLAHGLRDAVHVVRQVRLRECEVLVTPHLPSESREGSAGAQLGSASFPCTQSWSLVRGHHPSRPSPFSLPELSLSGSPLGLCLPGDPKSNLVHETDFPALSIHGPLGPGLFKIPTSMAAQKNPLPQSPCPFIVS